MLDILIRNGRVVDGSGNPWFKADIGVKDGKIVFVRNHILMDADRVINVYGLTVCPGFIDIHNHSDGALLVDPKAESMVRQGVTTLCIGNCGLSVAPVEDDTRESLRKYLANFMPIPEMRWHTFGEFLNFLEEKGVACNVAALVGHGSIRIAVMGFKARPPLERELVQMKGLVAQSMKEGAFGLSTGLAYAPGLFSQTDEIIELCKIVANYGGIYATHIRSDVFAYEGSVEEAIKIGEESGVSVQISHIETHYPNWKKMDQVMEIINEARARGLEVTCDVPPYLFGMTALTTLLPAWCQEGGVDGIIKRLKNSEMREKIKKSISTEREKHTNPSMALAADGHWEKIWIVKSEKNPHFTGKSLAQIAMLRGEEPYDAAFNLLIEEEKQIMIVGEFHNEDDLRKVLQHPTSMVASDERAYAASEALEAGRPHPRAYGTFPMIFRKYVRGEGREEMPRDQGSKTLPLEDAIRKMTSFPAQKLGLRDRGMIREGLWADIVVFDPVTIKDTATYEDPHQYPVGIHCIMVNGEVLVEEGKQAKLLPGRVLRGSGYSETQMT